MPNIASSLIADTIRARALGLGFDRVGFCPAVVPKEGSHFDRWLASGMHGQMEWMRRGRERRLDPRLVLDSARSLILVARSYATRQTETARPDLIDPHGSVARYARGDDYHEIMGDRLLNLEEFIEREVPGERALAYVDTGPFLERMWAAHAGIGWVGKNALVLNKEMGSYFFLGLVVTTLDLPPDEPALDQCGACTLCIEACPTGAIVEPRMVDSRLCIAYHTIELRGSIPPEHRAAIGLRVFGCDDCQTVCPWNRSLPPLSPASGLESVRQQLELGALLELTLQDYQARYYGTALARARYDGLLRNAILAVGYQRRREHLAAVRRHLASDLEGVRAAAEWAVSALGEAS